MAEKRTLSEDLFATLGDLESNFSTPPEFTFKHKRTELTPLPSTKKNSLFERGDESKYDSSIPHQTAEYKRNLRTDLKDRNNSFYYKNCDDYQNRPSTSTFSKKNCGKRNFYWRKKEYESNTRWQQKGNRNISGDVRILDKSDDGSDHESMPSLHDNILHKSNFEDKRDNHNSRKEDGKNNRIYGYKYLNNLSKKEAHEIIPEIMKRNSPFDTFLQKQELKPDWLFLIMKIMSNICLSGFVGNKEEILNHFCTSQFLNVISYYLGDVALEQNKNTIENLCPFMKDLTEFYSSAINVLPSVTYEKDFKKLIMKTKIAIDNVNTHLNVNIDEQIVKKLDALMNKLDDYKNAIEKKIPAKKERSFPNRIADLPPPENFRELSFYPSYEDLMKDKLGFVRPNKIKGAYDNVEHYLDVQFRLLREDFIDPLRRGIKRFLEVKSGNAGKLRFKYESVRLYPKSQFEQVEKSKSNVVGYVVDFDFNKKLRNIQWEYSKRFMHGSLLLFTSDDFRTFFYGTVLERDVSRLKNGKILIYLAEDVEVTKEFFTELYMMAESEVFFEPYFLVMKLLKNLDDDTFPMKRYIVNGESNTVPPLYLHGLHQWDVLGHRLDNKNLLANIWPSPDSLGLDEYQLDAFKTALSNDFCIVQGPPGTGKTFIGLKIVEVLLKNIALNANIIRIPILIVCYTNHALDQFLEGILKYTQKIVRIGGQSRSEILKPFNLRGRSNLSYLKNEAKHMYPTMTKIRNEIRKCREKIDRISKDKIGIENPIGILQLKYLNRFLQANQKKIFLNDANLLEWLLSVDVEEAHYCDEDGEIDFTYDGEKKEVEENVHESDVDEDDIDEDNRDALINEDDIFQPSTENSDSNFNLFYSITLQSLGQECQNQINEFTDLKENKEECLKYFDNYSTFYNRKHYLKKSIKIDIERYSILKKHLENPIHDPERVKMLLKSDMKNLGMNDRWLIYWYWVSMLRNDIIDQLKTLETICRSKMVQYEEYKQMEDLYVVQKALVVGMTTTGAARLQTLLRALHPAIVIVEEAAEVLEAHIVASLTHRCQHVILIGDHKQLKPSAAVYQLSKHYNIDVSLFERMINNGMYCPNLNVQHRMRPEISCLITPLIYPNLLNHASVFEYDSIRGVSRNVFFLEHNVFEEVVEDTSSRKNIFEAEFMLELCRYLVLQGYSPTNITILTTYTGQMYLLREGKKQYPLIKEVKCVVVDKYQGEENEIILLSLVRSNEEAKIGFLSIENRVCVALSRAKKALYIVGNMDNLAKSSILWTKIKKILEDQNAIGKVLELYCQKHDKITCVSVKNDFDKVREGGCNEYCGELMQCGHNCKSLCHIIDAQHVEIKCREQCQKMCIRLHPCQLLCYQGCYKCNVPVEKTLPCGHIKKLPCHVDEMEYLCKVKLPDISKLCNHNVIRECYQKAEDVDCTVPCKYRLDCGHACPKLCHKRNDPDHLDFKCKRPCDRLNRNCSKEHKCLKLCFEQCGMCSVMENFELSCTHLLNLQCSTDLTRIQCPKPCLKICPNCNLKCKKKCYEPCEPCINKVEKIIVECNHAITVKCYENPSRMQCRKNCESIAPCGHRCKSVCGKRCGSEKCFELVEIKYEKSLCGHKCVNIFCHLRNEVYSMDPEEILPFCNEPCNTLLQCGDVCNGNCGKCWQGRLHLTCQNPCNNVLVCGHSCKFPCRKVCPPCTETCSYECKHSKCNRECGVPCVRCIEKCDWKCEHFTCTRKCEQICNREPCYKPCQKRIKKCNHPCIGYCGEPCPPLCRICDKEEVTTIIFGYEEEKDARFVFLEDCQHTIESKAMDYHLSILPQDGEIIMKVCPLCKTPINKTLRYMNFVKQTYKHIINVKRTIFGNEQSILKTRVDLTNKLKRLSNDKDERFLRTELSGFHEFLNFLLLSLPERVKNRKNSKGYTELRSLFILAENFLNIAEIMKNNLAKIDKEFLKRKTSIKVERLLNTFREKAVCIKQYEIDFFYCEVRRLQRYVHFYSVECSPDFNKMKASKPGVYKSITVKLEVYPYTPAVDSEVEENLEEFLKIDFITPEEKEQIRKAMEKELGFGWQQGHWYACNCGYVYSVANCGMFNQSSRCPQCRATIGRGSNNRNTNQSFWVSDTTFE